MASDYLKFVLAGKLEREFILPLYGPPVEDIPGGNLAYISASVASWDENASLIARTGQDFSISHIGILQDWGMNVKGIKKTHQITDCRHFYNLQNERTWVDDHPVDHYANHHLALPRGLIDYKSLPFDMGYPPKKSIETILVKDIPEEYLEASLIHIGSLDFLSQIAILEKFQSGLATTISLRTHFGYMNSKYWEQFPSLISRLSVLFTTENELRSLFVNRSKALHQMVEHITATGCEAVIILQPSGGAILFDGVTSRKWQIPAYTEKATNPLGIEDAFCGGFLVGYRKNYDFLQGCYHGVVSASIACESLGAPSILKAFPNLAKLRLQAIQGSAQIQ